MTKQLKFGVQLQVKLKSSKSKLNSQKDITSLKCAQGQGYHDFYQYSLSQLVPKMNLDVSRYARDRYRLWLINEPSLSRQLRLTPAYNDVYLNKVIQWLYPNCNTALISLITANIRCRLARLQLK